jgi:hypothetical protein
VYGQGRQPARRFRWLLVIAGVAAQLARACAAMVAEVPRHPPGVRY